MLNPNIIRKDFPIFNPANSGGPLVYLDNAASTQKPYSVIEALTDFYSSSYANVHRGAYDLSELATQAFEDVRTKMAQFLNAHDPGEIIFTSGTTEGINLVAESFLRKRLKEGDNVVITAMEHHSNLIPWQMLCKKKGAELRVVPVTKLGELNVEAYASLLDHKTRMTAFVHVSNSLGTINPAQTIISLAKEKNIPVLLDGAQSVAHLPINLTELDCDFFVFSGHKIFGPTGTGVLFAKSQYLEEMDPYRTGGGMIRSVAFHHTSFKDKANRFEAGTPNIAGVIGLGAAVDYLTVIGLENIFAYNRELLNYATDKFLGIPGVRIIGQAKEKTGIISFLLDDIHPHDVATVLNEEKICIRAGHHCTEPLMEILKIPGTARASFTIYNLKSEIDQLADALLKTKKIFS